MIPTKPTESPNETAGNAFRWINYGLEFFWLLAVVAVPLAFVDRETFLSELELAYVDVPKIVLLRILVGLMAVLWIVEFVLQCGAYAITVKLWHQGPVDWLRSLTGWLHKNPTRWVTLAVVLYLVNILFSTALSESFRVSMWGLVPGQDTYPAYTIICYVVLFGVVATHLKSKVQVERLLWAVAFMGVVVGGYSWAQFYGYDVFNLREVPGSSQSGSTMGNSILAGSVFLLSITVSLAAAIVALSEPTRSGRFWGKLGLWTLILTVQMTGLIFASSRGPWVGTVAALVALIALGAVFTGWRSLGRMGLVLGMAVGLTAAIVVWPPPIPPGEPTRIEIGDPYDIPPPFLAFGLAQSTSSRITSIGREVGGGGLSSRLRIWKNSGRLMLHRPWFEFEDSSLSILRPLIGYGPDMFKYTYLLERIPTGPNRNLVSERFAHNYFIHNGVELGFLGLLTTLGLFAAPAIVGGYYLFRRRSDDSPLFRLLIVGLMAALAGRFTEQMVGVAAVSDTTIFWVLLALFAALPAVAGLSQTASRLDQGPQSLPRPLRVVPEARNGFYRTQFLLKVTIAVFIIAGIGTLTWYKSINYLEAGFEAREGLDRIRDAEFPNALVSLDRAIKLAPDVSVYRTLRAAVYSGYRRQDGGPMEPECGHIATGVPYQGCLARKEYLSHREAAGQRPLDWRNRLNLAMSAQTLSAIERDPKLENEAIRLYSEVAQLDPQTWWHWENLAAAQIQGGRPEAALEPLAKSLAILDGIPRSAISRLLEGMAYLQLGEPATALGAFNEAIRLNSDLADAYTNRGAAYNALGKYQRAIQDLDGAIKLNPEIAMAYNNRGNSYGNLNQLQRAIEDYDEAIRLDPQLALAYPNRALAYTYLGRDDEARMDVETAAQLGLDTGPILTRIEQVRTSR